MADRVAEPRIESTFARSGDPVDDPIWTCCTRLGVDRFGQPGIDQTIEGSIDQGSPHRDHASYFGIRLKCLGDGEAVDRSLGEETEDGVLGEGWLKIGHSDIRVDMRGQQGPRLSGTLPETIR